jgi:hypothetical protein
LHDLPKTERTPNQNSFATIGFRTAMSIAKTGNSFANYRNQRVPHREQKQATQTPSRLITIEYIANRQEPPPLAE